MLTAGEGVRVLKSMFWAVDYGKLENSSLILNESQNIFSDGLKFIIYTEPQISHNAMQKL